MRAGSRSRSPVPAATLKCDILPARDGLPQLEVLLTADARLAAAFLVDWEGCTDFGLDIEYRPTFEKGAKPPHCALLQICSSTRVLLFDLHVCRKRGQPLPRAIEDFLEDERHTFYGMGISDDLVRLAFEYDCVCRGVDLGQKCWPKLQSQRGGGLAKVSNRVLGTDAKTNKKVTMSNWEKRPLSPQQIQYSAADAYLSWALADFFLQQEPMEAEWLVTKQDMYARGMRLVEKGLDVPSKSKHEW